MQILIVTKADLYITGWISPTTMPSAEIDLPASKDAWCSTTKERSLWTNLRSPRYRFRIHKSLLFSAQKTNFGLWYVTGKPSQWLDEDFLPIDLGHKLNYVEFL